MTGLWKIARRKAGQTANRYLAVSLIGAGFLGAIPPLAAFALSTNHGANDGSNRPSESVIDHMYPEFSELSADIDPVAQGREFYAQGQFTMAAHAWQTAAETANSQGDVLVEALTRSYLSLAYQELNQWEDAQAAIDSSVEALKNYDNGVESTLWAQVLNTKAGLSYHLGQAEPALALWEEAEKFYRQAKDDSGILGSQINQAQALQSLGFYRRSRQQLETIAQQLSTMPDSELKVNGLRTLGTALQVLGDLSASRAALFESANIAIAIDATNELSATYLSLGRTASDWGDQSAAMEMFSRAKQVAKNPADELQADLSRLRFFVDQKESANVSQTASEVVKQLKALPPSRLSVYGTVNLSASLAKETQLGKSIPIQEVNQLLAKAVESAKMLNDKQAEAYALNQWGALYMQTQQWEDALVLTEKSLNIARTIQADDIASQSAWQLGRILKRQNNTTDAITAYGEAIDSLQSLRSDLVAIDPDVQFSFRENVEPIYREMVSLLLSSDRPTQTHLAQAREVVEALQLAELDNFFQEACIDVESQQIDQVDTQATVIYPIILQDKLAVISSSGGQLNYHATAISAADVEKTLQDLLRAIHPASDNRDRLALSEQVYNWLIRPIEASSIASETETMVFVLDGALRNVPIAALYDGNQYLIEKYAVALSPGLQLMSAQSLDQIEPAAVVGGISEARNGLSALPAVEDEIQDISELISAETLFNEQFTSDSLAKDVKDSSASIVHLATHGQFSSRLEDTFLSTWEGRLNVKELSEILQARGQSSAIELLVLSACDTASGDDRAVLGLAGLAVKSGARSTVATLWPVKDQAAAQMMRVLYENIGKEGVSKAEALRQAQLALIADPTYSDPFFWSAYTLVGNWR
ncbi:MAG: CHAT domain-containing protein [Phormidesmis sp.]